MSCEFPSEIGAGLTFHARLTLTAYPAPDWLLTAVLRGAGSIDLTAAADGRSHVFSASAATTAGWTAGLYNFSVRASRDGEVIAVESGQVRVMPDLASQTVPTDARTHNAIVLDNIRAVIENRATQDQQRYVINNRELWRTPMADLLALEALYAARVTGEKATARGRVKFGTTVYINTP